MAQSDKQKDFSTMYNDKLNFLNQWYQERVSFLSTFKLPGLTLQDLEDQITKLANGGSGSSSSNSSASKDGSMTVNMEGVPLPTNDFLKKVLPGAIEGYAKYNVLPSITLAQAVLESNWGKSGIGNNLFGIKAGSSWTGKTQTVWTHEEVNGQSIKVQAAFRDYDSIDDSVLDHAKLLSGSRYAKVVSATNYTDAAYAIKAAGYATDSAYPQKLISIIKSNKLDTWDDPKYKKLVDFTSVGSGTSGAKGDAAKIINEATSWLSKPNVYWFGGGRTQADIAAGKFDCSSWVYHVFHTCGYEICDFGGSTDSILSDSNAKKYNLQKISSSQLQPGDMVFWNTYKAYGHVGIYLGNNRAIGDNGDTGTGKVSYIDMNNSYWKPRLETQARRVT